MVTAWTWYISGSMQEGSEIKYLKGYLYSSIRGVLFKN